MRGFDKVETKEKVSAFIKKEISEIWIKYTLAVMIDRHIPHSHQS